MHLNASDEIPPEFSVTEFLYADPSAQVLTAQTYSSVLSFSVLASGLSMKSWAICTLPRGTNSVDMPTYRFYP